MSFKMEKINLNNYEAWFLDYHEGNLCAEDVAELMLFVEKHTELKEVFESFENITLDMPLTEAVFEGKEKMKKPVITLENYEAWFVDASDGTLDETSMQAVNYFLKEHPELETELKACKIIRLKPDLRIVFEGKEKLLKRLKKEERVRIIPFPLPAYRYVAAAASLALILGLWFYNRPETKWGDGNVYGLVENLSLKKVGQESSSHPVKAVKSSGLQATVKMLAISHSHTPVVRQWNASAPAEMVEMQRKAVPMLFTLNTQPETEVPANLVAVGNGVEVGEQDELNKQSQTLKEFASRRLQEAVGIQNQSNKGRRHPVWDVAKVAARGLNRVSPGRIKIKEEYNAQGTLVSYAMNSGDLEYSRAVKK
jgi:hypothetical protein